MGGGVSTQHPSGFDEKYEFVENSDILGTGAYSKVVLAINKSTREEVAVKVIKKDAKLDANDIEGINREISILKELDCPYTIKLIDVYEEKTDYRIVNELVDQRMIEHILTVNRYSEKMARKIMEQLFLGLEYIHGKYNINYFCIIIINMSIINIYILSIIFLNTTILLLYILLLLL